MPVRRLTVPFTAGRSSLGRRCRNAGLSPLPFAVASPLIRYNRQHSERHAHFRSGGESAWLSWTARLRLSPAPRAVSALKPLGFSQGKGRVLCWLGGGSKSANVWPR